MYKDILLEKDYYSYYKTLRDDNNVYSTYLQIFLNAALIGCMENKQRFEEKNDSETRNRIPLSVIINNKYDFECIINVITFMHYLRIGEERIFEKVFIDSDDALKQKQEIAENYARGGIKKLHDLIMEDVSHKEDIMDNILDVLDDPNAIEFKKEIGSIEDVIKNFV